MEKTNSFLNDLNKSFIKYFPSWKSLNINLKLSNPINFHEITNKSIESMNTRNSFLYSLNLTLKDSDEEKEFKFDYLRFFAPTHDNTLIIDGIEYYPVKRFKEKSTGNKESLNFYSRNLKFFTLDIPTVQHFLSNMIILELCKNKKEILEKIKFFKEKNKAFLLPLDRFINNFKSEVLIKKHWQIVDFTNPLSRIESLKKLVFSGSIFKRAGRNPHPSHIGRICIVESPESEKLGLILYLAYNALISDSGNICVRINNKFSSISIFYSPFTEPKEIFENLKNKKGSYLSKKNDNINPSLSSKFSIFTIEPEQFLGYCALQIPFIHHNDPARALMGAKNIKQALPINNTEQPLIATGFEGKILTDSLSIIKSPVEGIVDEITSDKIKIRTGSEVYEQKLLKNYHSVTSSTCISHKPNVKKGDKVYKNSTIAELEGIVDGKLALGANLLVAYMPYFGYNMDDAIVISESAAKKFRSKHMFKSEYALTEKYSDLEHKKENERVHKGEYLIRYRMQYLSLDNICENLRNIDKNMEIEILENLKKEFKLDYSDLNDILNCKNFYKRIRDKKSLKINVTGQEKIIIRNFKILMELFPQYFSKRKEILADDEHSGSIISYVKIETDKIIFWFLKHLDLQIGDKLMGRHGNKGVVSKILPDNKMPFIYLKDGSKKHIEIILNPLGIVSRMNLGQLLETHLGWVARHHPNDEVKNEARKSGFPFKKIDYEKISTWLEESGLNKEGKTYIYLDEKRKTQKPVTVGYQYFLKLNHLAQLKISAYPKDGRVSVRTFGPTKSKQCTPQRIGEMETWALISHGEIDLLKEMFTVRSSSEYTKDGASISGSINAFSQCLSGLGIQFKLFDSQGNQIDLRDRIFPNKAKKYSFIKFDICNQEITSISEFEKKFREIFVKREVLDRVYCISLESIKDKLNWSKGKDSLIKKLILIPLRQRYYHFNEINIQYKRLLTLINEISKSKDNDKKIEIIEKIIKKIEKINRNMIKGKWGIIRRDILGRRVKESGRAVIVPEPKLLPYQVSIPFFIAKRIGLEDGDKVLLNRQPTLHNHNMQVFRCVINRNPEENVIKINPLICKGFNADFDGDTMSIFKIDESFLRNKSIYSENQLFSCAISKPILNISQDIILGLYLLSKTEDGREKIENHIKNSSIYKKSDDFELSKLDILIEKFYLFNNRENKKVIDMVYELSKEALDAATLYGISLSYSDFLDYLFSENEKKICLDENVQEPNKKALNIIIKKSENLNNNPLTIIFKSGARGSWENLRQMSAFRGSVEIINENEETVNSDIKIINSYIEGLTPFEYFLACYGARKSLGDKKLMTPHCGYLTRRLVYSSADMNITEEDCKSNKTFEIPIDFALGRYYYKNKNENKLNKLTLIDEKEFSELKEANEKRISVRSPLGCRAKKGICRICYGWELGQRELPKIGLNVGILAATVIGERATQDAMKTFHTGTATETLNLFERTAKTFDRLIIKDESEIPDKIYTLCNEIYEKKVDIKHFEVIFKSLLRYFLFGNLKIRTINISGTERVIDKIGGPLHSISFENPIKKIREIAETGKTYKPETIFEKMFLW